MGEYCLDRFNGKVWTTCMVAQHPIGPGAFHEHHSSAYPSDPNRPAFSGDIGYKLRVRYVDVSTDMELESYDWAQVPINPNDPDSMTAWGWKCTKRATYPSNAPVQNMKIGVSW